MARKVVNHLNFIAVPTGNPNPSDLEVFCKKLHKVTAPDIQDCENCPYFSGAMQGYGHECTWEDIVPATTVEWVVEHADRHKELMRVSRQIDKGRLKRG